jgi:putative membrane protein
MTRLLTTTAVLALLAAAPAWAQATRPTTTGTAATAAGSQALAQQDADFAKDAAIGGRFEVDMGKTAQSKAQSQDVKDFGKHMVDDHGKANDKLAAVAKDLKITLPSALDQKHKDTVDRLSKLSGDQFDREYMAEMVKDHQEDAGKFQKEIASGNNAQLKAFATETLTVIQQHQKMAQDTQSKLGPPRTAGAPATSSSGSSGTRPSPSGTSPSTSGTR